MVKMKDMCCIVNYWNLPNPSHSPMCSTLPRRGGATIMRTDATAPKCSGTRPLTVRRAAIFAVFGSLALAWVMYGSYPPGNHLLPQSRDIAEIRVRVSPDLRRDLAASGLSFGAPVFLRIFKEESTLELWVQDGAEFRKFRDYEICNYSGHLGPKLREGDRQSPEGFYSVPKSALNPKSRPTGGTQSPTASC